MSSVENIPLDAFRVYQGKEEIMHLGVGMTLYFPRPFRAIGLNVLSLWRKYLAIVPEKTFTWARLGGGNRSRQAVPAVFKTIESWFSGAKYAGDICWVSLHDGCFDCLGEYSFMLTGYGDPKDEFDEEAGFLDIVFPVRVLDELGGPKLAEMFIDLASCLPFYCGVAGYVFHRSPYKFNATLESMKALAKRFEGVEIAASERLCYLAARGLTTINWLTFIGEDHLVNLGGRSVLTERLKSLSIVIDMPYGVAVKTGDDPILGDRNSGRDELMGLRKLYGILSPAQFFDSSYAFHDLRFDGDSTVEWLTRLGR